ncbi:MAG: hypothetical protein E7035_02015 [Verrucomicrobiaceae bacterium]|nr:hypothetical protein [Verrucomicrobiaceae bacterium]
MSELEKIQRLIQKKLSTSIDFSQISVNAEGYKKAIITNKSTSQIIVMRPFPISAIQNSNKVVFDNVELKIKIHIPIAESEKLSALTYAEKICKKLHNSKISTATNFGKILISQNEPFEILNNLPNIDSYIIKFIINGVKI